jgi:iron complex outermembrane receptor protein
LLLASLGLTLSRAWAQTSDAGAPPPEAETPAADGVTAETPPAPAPPPEAADAGSGATPAPPATEPAAEPAAAAGAGDMVVTAQRYEQDVQKTPVAVSAFSVRAMDQRGVTNLQDLSKFTPNLQLQATNRPAGGSSSYAAYIRGIGTGDFQFPTDPGVGLYIDDVYMARTVGGLLSTDADIARIEVIKGPQGTLFGRNTIGGAFNITTSKPVLSGPAIGSGLFRFGTYGRRDFSFGVSAPVVEDRIGAKISFSSLHSDGYGTRLMDDVKTSTEDRFVARAGLLFKLTDDFDVRLDGDYSHQNQIPPGGEFIRFAPAGMTVDKINKYNQFAAPALNPGLGLPNDSIFDARFVSPNARENYALQPMHDRYDMGGGSLRIHYAPQAWLNIKSISALRSLTSDIAVDGDQTPYPLQSSATKLDDTQFSEELQFYGDTWSDRFTYMVGLYAFRETGHSTVDTQSFHGLFESQTMPLPGDAADTLTNYTLTATSYAAFTQETLEILKGLHLTAGARLNHDEKDYSYSVDFPERGVPQVPLSHANASWDSFTPKLGADWSPIEPLMLYASYAQGFKSGGFGPSSNASNPTPKYDPERVTTYELGLKTHWLENRRLITNLAGFYSDYRDIQLTVQSRDPVTGGNVRTTENAGRSLIKGFEADVLTSPFRGFTLNGGVGYVDARFHDLTTNAEMSGFKKNDRLPQIPAWTISAGAQYAIESSVGEFTLRADVSFKSDQFLTAVDTTSYQKAYTLLSARIAFVPQGLQELEIALYGVNLTDTLYYVYRATLAPTGQELGIAGPPRLFFATAKYTL